MAVPTHNKHQPFTAEWPTILLMLVVWAIEMAVITQYNGLFQNMGWWLLPILVLCMTLQLSLQHEILHGHPTNNIIFNTILGWLQLGLFWNFNQFKRLHLIHHNDQNLTHPQRDPESYFHFKNEWAQYSPFRRFLYQMNQILLMRFVFGPAMGLYHHYGDMLKNPAQGWVYIPHFVMVGIILLLLHYYQFPIILWVLASYIGLSFIAIRSFMEHRLHPNKNARTIIVESYYGLGFLYLYNNFHVVHHQHPKMAWYKIPAEFTKNRQKFIAMNDGYYFQSYWQIIKQFAFKPANPLVYIEKK